jgi:hypothetical protein
MQECGFCKRKFGATVIRNHEVNCAQRTGAPIAEAVRMPVEENSRKTALVYILGSPDDDPIPIIVIEPDIAAEPVSSRIDEGDSKGKDPGPVIQSIPEDRTRPIYSTIAQIPSPRILFEQARSRSQSAKLPELSSTPRIDARSSFRSCSRPRFRRPWTAGPARSN